MSSHTGSRRVGMSRTQNPPSLHPYLKDGNGKAAKPTEQENSDRPSKHPSNDEKLETRAEIESYQRPPEPCSGEEDGEDNRAQQKDSPTRYDSSDDDDGRPSRADMTFTSWNFSTNKASGGTTTGPGAKAAKPTLQKGNGETPRRSARQPNKTSTPGNAKRSADDSHNEDADSAGSRGLKRLKENSVKTDVNIGTQHIVDPTQARKPPRAKFGKGKGQGRLKSHFKDPSESPEKPKLKVPHSLSASPEASRSKDLKGNKYDTSSPPKKRLRQIDNKGFHSDTPSPRKVLQHEAKDVDFSDNDRKQKHRPTPDSRRRAKASGPNIEDSPEEFSQKPDFKLPVGHEDLHDDRGFEILDLSLIESPTQKKKDPNAAFCPMCEEPVDKEWLSKFSKNQRMAISRQSKFCRLHKKKSARETWAAKGYPDIDWEKLGSRIAKHHGYVTSLIEGKSSHFGRLLQEKIDTGANRTLLTTSEYLTPGYYGLWGLSVMTERIIEDFSSLIRERAPHDRLISARGFTGYVQTVLVPELAVKLIQEDMSLDQAEARVVMEESRAVGMLLHDDKGDVVLNERDDDEIAEQKDWSEDGTPVKPKIAEIDDSSSDLSSLGGLSD